MKTLLALGPFAQVNLTSDPFFLKPGEGAVASNVDISYAPGAFVTSLGREQIGMIDLPNDNLIIQAIAPFYSYFGETSNQDTHVGATGYQVFSAIVPDGTDSYQGYYQLATGAQVHLPNLNPFTHAVQFGDTLYTNGGDRVVFVAGGGLAVDDWQIQVLPELSYKILAGQAATTGNATPQLYQYAVTFRRAGAWTRTVKSGGEILLSPDLNTYQESSPVLTPNHTIGAMSTDQPTLSVPASAAPLSALVQGTTAGGETYYGVLYRSSALNPTFVMVDYLINFPTGTDVNGVPCFIDKNSDASIENNVILSTHNDVPPIIGQVYPGPALANLNTPNSGPIRSTRESQLQQAFTYTNTTFIEKHKSRMFTFTLYPTNPLAYEKNPNTPYDNRAQFQPQLWYSNYGVPWAFNDVTQFLLVGPEDTSGNYQIDANIATQVPWAPGQSCDTPMGLVSIGSLLILFKLMSTWVLFGDSPAEFQQGLRRALNYGCVSTQSIVSAEGGVFWLCGDPRNVWFFDGASPSYISEPIRGDLEKYTLDELSSAAGGYSDRTYYLTFNPSDDPTSPAFGPGITYCYYTASQQWYTLPYGGTFMFSPAFRRQSSALVEQLVGAARISDMQVNLNDLGVPITAEWLSEVSDAKMPGQLKKYSNIAVVAPNADATLKVSLGINGVFDPTWSKSWDLNEGSTSRVFTLPGKAVGYTAQLKVEVTNNLGAGLTRIQSIVVNGEDHGPVQSTSAFDGTLTLVSA